MKYGLVPSPADPRDFRRAATAATVGLAPSCSLAIGGWLPPVKNQGQDEDCLAAAMTYGRKWMRYKYTREERDFSFHWFWWQLRLREGTTTQNAGTYLRDAMKVSRKQGFCPDELMPQWQGNYEESPPAGTDQAAFPYRITRYLRCNNLTDIKTEIALGNPVVLGVLVNNLFERGGVNGVIDFDGDANWLGGHAIWPYAYTDDARFAGGGYVTIRNQWDTTWGIGGDAYLTYAFMQSQAVFEMWAYE